MTKARLDLAILLGIALLANVAYLVCSNGDFYFPDSRTYLVPAEMMLQGHGFADEPGEFDTIRTPGYPLFLLPFLALTKSHVPILLAQHLFNCAMTLAIYLAVRRLIGSRSAAYFGALAFALDTPAIHYANKVLTETLFTTVLLALVLWVLSMTRTGGTMPRFALAGLVCGALVLIRPAAILYFAVLALYFAVALTKRTVAERGRILALFVIAALLLPIGWGLRNRIRVGIFTVCSISGVNILLHRAAGALAMERNYDFAADLSHFQDELLAQANDVAVQSEHVASLADLPHAVRAKYYTQLGQSTFLHHPHGALLLTVRGLLVNLFDSDWDALSEVTTVPEPIVHVGIVAWTAILFVFVLAGLLALWRLDRIAALLLGLTIVYFVAISAGSEAESRFRVPILPEYAIAAGIGFEAIRRGIRSIGSAEIER